MRADRSALFVPKRVTDEELVQVLRDLLPNQNLSVLIADQEAGGLADGFEGAYLGLSLWSVEALVWDDVAAALSVLVPGPLLALTWSGESEVGCWQTFRDGEAGPAHWEDDLSLAKRGFRRLFRTSLAAEVDLLEALVTPAQRGVRLEAGDWTPFGVEESRALRGGAGEATCCLLGHHLGDLAEERSDPVPRDVPSGPNAGVDDHEVVGELIMLPDLTPAQLAFVTDLARRVLVLDLALTPGQRRRGAQLLKSMLTGSGSGKPDVTP